MDTAAADPMPKLSLALLVLLSTSCYPWCQASLKCYHNGNEDSMLKYELGDEGLVTCIANSQCMEAVASDVAMLWRRDHYYASGCDSCPWQAMSECKTCQTDLCNNKAAIKIRKNNRLCYFASNTADVGREAVWCIAGEDHCYWSETDSKYYASCGTNPNCQRCHVCKENLCNYPPQFENTRLKPGAYMPKSAVQTPAQKTSETKPKPRDEEKESKNTKNLPATPLPPKKNKKKPRTVKEKPKDAAAAGESSKDPEDASSQADDADTQKEKAPAKATTQKSKDDKKAAARCKPPKCRKGGNGSETAADVKKKVKKLGDDEDDSGDPDEARDTGSAVRVRLITVIVTTGTALIARIARI